MRKETGNNCLIMLDSSYLSLQVRVPNLYSPIRRSLLRNTCVGHIKQLRVDNIL